MHSLVELKEMKLEYFKQLACGHRWKKLPGYRQLKKDQNKVLWVCPKCNKLKERFRWDPPLGQ